MSEAEYAKNLLLEMSCNDCEWSIWYPGILGRPGLCSLHEERPIKNKKEICEDWELKDE